jgi:hypothetical protein
MTVRLSFEQAQATSGWLKHQSYNCADAAGTLEIAEKLLPRLKGRNLASYRAHMAFQNPAMAMMRRGVRVDQAARKEALAWLEEEGERELARIAELVAPIWDGTEKETGSCPSSKRKDGKHTWTPSGELGETGRECLQCGSPRLRPMPFNANSSPQVKHLLYDLLKLPPLKNKMGAISADEDVLQRLAKKHPKHAELIGWEPDEAAGLDGSGILYVRSLKKQAGEVKAPLSVSGRYMFSMNIGATWTGRSSSSSNPMKLGGNIQNKAQRLRRMFIADPGMEMGNFDLCQAESLVVAYRARDASYIEAHLSGDVHTANTRILYPGLPWTGDLSRDKKIASTMNPPWDPAPGHDYRFQAKRITHGYAYGLSAAGVAAHAKIPRAVAEDAHGRLHDAYPGIRDTYQAELRERARAGLPIVTPLNHSIQLFGRPWDEATWRQAYAGYAQSTIGHLVWLACTLIYRDLDPHLVQVLQNGYDSILVQWRKEHREQAIQAIVSRMEIPMQIEGQRCLVPVEGTVGTNWMKAGPDNPNGQKGTYP